jgi:hypothetical protein
VKPKERKEDTERNKNTIISVVSFFESKGRSSAFQLS